MISYRKMKILHIRHLSTELLRFIPKHNPVVESDIEKLKDFIFNSSKVLVLTGAGISTESGIPDYRSEEVGLYARTNYKPIQHQEFLKSEETRKRYWARNYVGWSTFSVRQPNSVHYSVTDLEIKHGKVSNVVTQNVDSLHFKAGSRNVTELHGTAFRVICLECDAVYCRHFVQEKLEKINPGMPKASTMIRPDGDVEIPVENIRNFKPPFCDSCGGILKPDITFFGDNIPLDRVEGVRSLVSESDSLLVLGSSLSVFSGYRIVLQAAEQGKKIAIVNIGTTRADSMAGLKISARCGDILPKVTIS